jgi:hypothetical protein
MSDQTIDVTTDFVDHLHIYTSPTGRVFVQHELQDGAEGDPHRAITLLVQAARMVAAAHHISLEGD